jgi:transposase
MIHLPASVRVYLCLTACDMRKSFDGLHQLVRDYLQMDAFAGHLFVFTSRRRDRLKILYWDRDPTITATARTLDVARIAPPSWCDDGEIARPCYFGARMTHKLGAATSATSATR